MENILEVKGISKNYKGFKLENINFNVPKGTIVGFIGENGAGKTTTIKIILDIIKKHEGTVKILGIIIGILIGISIIIVSMIVSMKLYKSKEF